MRRLVLPFFLSAFLLFPACSTSGAPDIQTKEVTYMVGGTKCTGFLAWDGNKEGKRPGVLVVHEWWGHNDYVRKRARMLAEMGYTALALDMYGDGKSADHPKDAQKFMMEVMGNMDVGARRFVAAKTLLNEHETTDAGKTAAIGYCFGGAVVLHMARRGMDLKGVASFHGSLSTKAPAQRGAVKARILVCHGADDSLVPDAQVDAFQKEMNAAEAKMEFHSYKGAKHGFTNPAATANGEKFALPLAYDELADKASWQALDKFLKEVFADE